MASTILCADDDRQLASILQKALEGEGHRVLVAHDGNEAVSLIREESPDLALLEVLLPKRDGFEVLSELRSLDCATSQIPALMTTGCRVTPEYQDRADRLGASAILAKPVPLEALFEIVRKHLKEPPPRVQQQKSARARGNTGKARGAHGRSTETMSGRFSDISFAHLLHHLHGLRATGVLILASGRKKKAIQLRDGYPVAVKSNLVGECLGNLLQTRGVLSDDAFDESIARVKKGEGLQGQILVAMELLTEEEVTAALREQAEEKLFEIFEWKRGTYQFQFGGRLKRGNALALEASPASLILRGTRNRVPIEGVDEFLKANAGRFVMRSESPFYRFQDIELGEEGDRVVNGLDGTQQLGDFMTADEETRRVLYALAASEMVDLRAAQSVGAVGRSSDGAQLEAVVAKPTAKRSATDSETERSLRSELAALAERLRGQSYFEMLEVDQLSSVEQIDASFERTAKQTHPDKFSNASSAVRQLAEEVHQMVSTAHETLVDPKARQAYLLERRKGERRAAEQAEGRKALEAEIAFQKGEAHIRSRDYELALMDFGRALQIFPEEGEYHAHYGWCLHLCHPDDASIVQEAIEHVKRGVKLARDREKPYLFLGRLFKVAGKGAAAEKMFTRAVQIRPDCVEALRELRLINLRKRKSKGLVRRLLRR